MGRRAGTRRQERDTWRGQPPPAVEPDEGSSELGDLIEDERASDTPGEVMREMETAGLEQAIERLPERHRYVLLRRYGLDDRDVATLAQLSDELGISREQVRQLQREAERMLAKGEFEPPSPTRPEQNRACEEGARFGAPSFVCPDSSSERQVGEHRVVVARVPFPGVIRTI